MPFSEPSTLGNPSVESLSEEEESWGVGEFDEV